MSSVCSHQGPAPDVGAVWLLQRTVWGRGGAGHSQRVLRCQEWHGAHGSSLHHLPAFPYDRLHAEGLKTSGRPQPCWAGSLPSSEGKGSLCGRCSLTHSDEQEKRGPLTGGIDALPVGCYDAWSQGKALPLSWCPGERAAGEGLSSAWMTVRPAPPSLSRDGAFS